MHGKTERACFVYDYMKVVIVLLHNLRKKILKDVYKIVVVTYLDCGLRTFEPL